MTVNEWSLVRFAHVLGAAGWVGGQLVLSMVVLPVLRSDVGQPVRGQLIHKTATRFAAVANLGLLPLLLLSGVGLAWHRGVTLGTLGEQGYGRLLSIKLLLVVGSVTLAGLHGVLVNRRPLLARSLAIGGLGSSVGIVVFATALVP